MNPIDFSDLVSNKNGQNCRVETSTCVYNGVYLRQGTEGGLQIGIQPTGERAILCNIPTNISSIH